MSEPRSAASPPARRRRIAPPALAVAIAASALVHASVLAVRLASGGHELAADAPVLQVRLTLPAPAAPAPLVVPAATTLAEHQAPVPMVDTRIEARPVALARRPLAVAQPDAPPIAVSDDVAAVAELVMPAAAAEPSSGDNLVAAEPLLAMARLGDELLARSQSEFPIEVQFPPRVHGDLKALYPQAALAQGLQGDVIAWVVVGPDGNVQEIEFAAGDAIFREAVADAIRAGAFQPAADAGVGVAFPIALEFRFVLADAASGADDGFTP